jgi:hypothetical protein
MMVACKALGLTVLVVALLVTLTGVAAAQSTELSPHFKCYVITPALSLNEPIRLGDQFHPIDITQPGSPGGESVVVRDPEFVCTPVTVKCRTDAATGIETCVPLEQPLPPFDHLKCHNITPSGPPVNQAATVNDQFGPESLTVRTAQFLCAPATKTIP